MLLLVDVIWTSVVVLLPKGVVTGSVALYLVELSEVLVVILLLVEVVSAFVDVFCMGAVDVPVVVM